MKTRVDMAFLLMQLVHEEVDSKNVSIVRQMTFRVTLQVRERL